MTETQAKGNGVNGLSLVKAGNHTDVCPNCGIWRQHAGNPLACGDAVGQSGCFLVAWDDPKEESDVQAVVA